MTQILCLMMSLSVVSIYPYAFVHGSKSDLDEVQIRVGWNDSINAQHCPVKRGNKGRGAEWNWEDIEKKSKGKVKKGDSIPFLIFPTFGKCGGILLLSDALYQGTIPSDGRFGFVVKRSKDARNTDVYTLVPDQEAEKEYKPA